MEPMNYGEMVAAHLGDMRRDGRQLRAGRRADRVAHWRLVTGRFLVAFGERLQGCERGWEVSGEPRVTLQG